MASKGIVLVTGANGYIAPSVMEALLQAGYSVRGTVRAKHKADAVVNSLSKYADRLEIVEVPDITAPGAFESAAKGCIGVAHVAAPVTEAFLNYKGDPEPLMKAYVQGSVCALEAAANEPSVKSFVYMGSLAAHVNEWIVDKPVTSDDWNTTAEKTVEEMGKQAETGTVYAAGKTAGEKAIWKFREERKPKCAIFSVNPCIVAGPPVVKPTSPEQIPYTTKSIWEVFIGTPLDKVALETHQGFVDVRDVARLVVFGVEHPEKVDGERVLAAAAFGPPQSMADILLKKYPEREGIIQKGTPGHGYLPGYKSPTSGYYDGSKAVKMTGQEYLPWEKTVVDVIESLKHLA